MAASSKRPGSIDEAMQILDDALAGRSEEFKDLMSEEFQAFKADFSKLSNSFSMDSIGGQLRSQIRDFGGQALSRGQDFFFEAASKVDSRVRANPWPVIGGVAVGTFALGFFYGRAIAHEPTALVEQ